jgi:hypothetical protein
MILQPIQTIELGKLYIGKSEQLFAEILGTELQGKARLIFILSPFPPNEKKKSNRLKVDKHRSREKLCYPFDSSFLMKMRKILVPAMLIHLQKTINI